MQAAARAAVGCAEDAATPAAGAVAGAPPSAAAAEAADPGKLRQRLLPALRAAVRGFRSTTGDADGELKLTVLVTWPGCQGQTPQERSAAARSWDNGTSSDVDIFVHASPLPQRPAPPVRVVVRGAPRSNAAAKDSEWVRKRKAIEAGLPPGVNEVGAGWAAGQVALKARGPSALPAL